MAGEWGAVKNLITLTVDKHDLLSLPIHTSLVFPL